MKHIANILFQHCNTLGKKFYICNDLQLLHGRINYQNNIE